MNTGVGCHFLLQCMKVKSESEVAQSCPTLRDPMDCSLPGSAIHEIFQARVLEWVATAFFVKKAERRRIDAFELWCWRRLLIVPWTSRRSNQSRPVHPKGDQSWVFIGRTDVEAKTPILWPPDANSWFIGKDPDAGKDWGQEEKGMTEDEMVWWHHRLNGHGFGWTLGVGDWQGGLACCSSWGRKESDTTEWLNWT